MFVILQMLCWNKQTSIGRFPTTRFLFEGNELSKQQANHWPTEAAAIGTNKKLSIKRIPSTVTKIRPEPISAERADNAKRYGGRENNRTVEISWYEVTERANIFVPPSPPPIACICENQLPQPQQPQCQETFNTLLNSYLECYTCLHSALILVVPSVSSHGLLPKKLQQLQTNCFFLLGASVCWSKSSQCRTRPVCKWLFCLSSARFASPFLIAGGHRKRRQNWGPHQ